jgi:hypothetical protein
MQQKYNYKVEEETMVLRAESLRIVKNGSPTVFVFKHIYMIIEP